MTLRNHLIAGAVATAILFPFFGAWKSLLFYASSVLIDIDHYLEYLYRVRKTTGRWPDPRPKAMFKYYDQYMIHQTTDNRVIAFALLHTVEAFLVLFLLARYVNYTFFIIIIAGMAYHIIFDVVSMAWQRLHFLRPYSLVEYMIRMQHKRSKGIEPDHFGRDMYEFSKERN